MKITDVKVDLFTWHSEPWQTGVGTQFSESQLGLVSVETDAGVTGNAFLGSLHVGADHYAKGLVKFLKPLLLGRDPQDIGAIWWEMWKQNRKASVQAIGAVDICLWDINGKIANQPIHRLLGTCRHSVPVYSSTAHWDSDAEYVEEALRFKEQGWPAHKIHPHGRPAADIRLCEVVRDAVGDDMKLMLDSMWAYQYEDALRVGRAIEELDFYWYEDPLVEEDIYSYVKLHQKLDIPIMSTESAPGRFYGMATWITQYATDYLRGDVMAETSGRTNFLARVAGNSLDIVLRDLELGAPHRDAERARLRNLLGADESLEALRWRLVHALRDGSMPLDHPGLAAHLRETVVNQVAIDQPKYSGFKTAVGGT